MADAIPIGGRLTLMEVAKAVNKLNGDFREHIDKFEKLTNSLSEQTAETKKLNASIGPIVQTIAGYEVVRKSTLTVVRWLTATAITALMAVLIQSWWNHNEQQKQLTQISAKAGAAASASTEAATESRKAANAIGVP